MAKKRIELTDAGVSIPYESSKILNEEREDEDGEDDTAVEQKKELFVQHLAGILRELERLINRYHKIYNG